MTEKTELPSSLLNHIPWEGNTKPLWPVTAFTLKRNLAQYLFPPKMNESQMRQSQDLIKSVLMNAKILKNPVFLPAEQLSTSDREFISEYFLGTGSFQNVAPGQGFIVDDDARFLATINIDDHLHLEMLDTQDTWDSTWNMLSALESSLSNAFSYAFSTRFGYLTSDPASSGTGLTVSSFIHVPALIHLGKLSEALQNQSEENVIAAGLLGGMENLIGDLLVLRNRYSLGVSEDSILQAVHTFSMKLVLAEKTLRTNLEKKASDELKDKVSRAYGLLVHSYQLQTKEALDYLSMIKLGIDEGWIKGISDQKINTAFFQCRRSHLPYVINQKSLSLEEVPLKRAELLHKHLEGMSLAI